MIYTYYALVTHFPIMSYSLPVTPVNFPFSLPEPFPYSWLYVFVSGTITLTNASCITLDCNYDLEPGGIVSTSQLPTFTESASNK